MSSGQRTGSQRTAAADGHLAVPGAPDTDSPSHLQIGVFSPSLRNHYLNVTPNNLVHIYSLDSGDSDCLEPPQPLPKVSGAG